jgi:hypothetical protein
MYSSLNTRKTGFYFVSGFPVSPSEAYRVIIFFHDSKDLVLLGLLIVEVSKSHSDTPRSVGILWRSGRLVPETYS